jgi:hypothetical protein
MAKTPETSKRADEQHDHKGKKRPNYPPVGIVEAKSDAVLGKKTEGLNSLEVAAH